VGHFVLLVLGALVVGAIVFGAAVFIMGGDRGLTPPRPDGVPFDLPSNRPLAADDVEGLRFDTVVRGYRMSQVDEVLARVADDLDWAYTRIAQLERVNEAGRELSGDGEDADPAHDVEGPSQGVADQAQHVESPAQHVEGSAGDVEGPVRHGEGPAQDVAGPAPEALDARDGAGNSHQGAEDPQRVTQGAQEDVQAVRTGSGGRHG
jgi:DivIVA domain-containing protein